MRWNVPARRRLRLLADAGRTRRGGRRRRGTGPAGRPVCRRDRDLRLRAARQRTDVDRCRRPGRLRRAISTTAATSSYGAPTSNALVGCEINLGQARCRGRRLCEPCAHLDRLNGGGVLRPLVHRAPKHARAARGVWSAHVAIRQAERQLAEQAEATYRRMVKTSWPGPRRERWARARHRSAHEVGPQRGKAARQTQSS